jgi:hypothetical protein
MSYIEADYQDKMMEELRKRGARVVAFVGNRYLAGEPDIEVTSRLGAIIKIEFKLWRKTKIPTRDDIVALLDGPQINVVKNQLWGRNAPLLMIAGFAEVKGKSAIVNKTSIMFDNDENIVNMLSYAPFGTYPYNSTVP